MKKLTSIILLVFAVTLTTQAQRGGEKREHEKLSIEQKTNLAVKHMTLKLDLTTAQQQQIKPLIEQKVREGKAHLEKMKASKKDRKKRTADEIYAMKSKRLDMQIEMKNKMKNILNEKQYEKYEKMHERRMMMMKKKMKKRKGRKKRKEHKEDNEH